jgi:hypothetical protein
MEQVQKSWVVKARALPRKVLARVIAQAKKRYGELKHRYGPRYTYAMVSAAFFTLFVPIPGLSVVSVVVVVAIAELHRAFSGRRRLTEAVGNLFKRSVAVYPGDLVMSTNCDVVLKWSATPEQLRAVGDAFWRWCNGAEGNTGVYQHLDNQALADLIAGRFPASHHAPWSFEPRGIQFRVRAEASQDRQATLDSLRRAIPAGGIEDIIVDDLSWHPAAHHDRTCASLQELA